MEYLENLVSNIEKYLIENMQSAALLSNSNNNLVYANIVDISDIVIEHKTNLQFNKNAKFQLESAVKYAFKDLKLFKRKIQMEKEGKLIL